MSVAPAPKPRGRQTARDMVLSMAVVGVVVLVVAAPWRRVEPNIPLVEWQPVAAAFEKSVSWPVSLPKTVPAGWRSTTARIEPMRDGRTALHIGWLTDANSYVGLEQSDTRDVQYIKDRTSGGADAGTSLIGSDTWQRLQSADAKTRSLVRVLASVTVIVTGSGDWPALETFAAGLPVSSS